ncbi:MAG: hypothetical protein IJN65_02195 [Clostridia bacterium]|nr:hypothetical protein [Clostridia bacterium]
METKTDSSLRGNGFVQNVNSTNSNGTISLLDKYFNKDLISNIAIKIGKKDAVLSEVMKFREEIHNAIKNDLAKEI